jgi:hypothetical protein
VWPRESHSSVWVSESPLLALFLLHTYPVRSTTDSAGSKPNPAFVDLSWRGQGCALDSCDTVKSDCFTEDKSVLCPCVVGRGGGDPGDLLTLVFLWGGKLAQLTPGADLDLESCLFGLETSEQIFVPHKSRFTFLIMFELDLQ